jgi:tetratricopeptide (TPR) repeat protein
VLFICLVAFAMYAPYLLHTLLVYTLRPFRLKTSPWLLKTLFWITILGISAEYSLLTIKRNPAWKNDDVLFKEALRVCPNSAKMNLMNAKSILMSNMQRADKLVKRALEIDPDHCDSRLIEAQLDMYLRKDVNRALLTAADNLKCKFIMTGLWDIMSKIFQHKVQERPNDPGVREYVADVLVRAGVSLIAAKTYQEAVLMYFNQGLYADAIRVSSKVEQRIPYFLLAEDDGSSLPAVQEQTCNVYALGGSLRSFLATQPDKLATVELTAQLTEEISRAKELLFRAAQPNCTLVDERTKVIVYSHSVSASTHYIGLLKFEYHASGGVLDALALLDGIDLAILSLDKLLNAKTAKETVAFKAQMKGFLVDAAQVSAGLGKHYLKTGEFLLSADALRRSIRYSSHKYSGEQKNCHPAHYWLANAIAQLAGFTTNSDLMEEVLDALSLVADCDNPKVPARMRRQAADEFDDLDLFVDQRSRLVHEQEVSSI